MSASGPTPPPVEPDKDLRRMAPVYVAVIVVEGIVLVALFVFQTYFGAR